MINPWVSNESPLVGTPYPPQPEISATSWWLGVYPMTVTWFRLDPQPNHSPIGIHCVVGVHLDACANLRNHVALYGWMIIPLSNWLVTMVNNYTRWVIPLSKGYNHGMITRVFLYSNTDGRSVSWTTRGDLNQPWRYQLVGGLSLPPSPGLKVWHVVESTNGCKSCSTIIKLNPIKSM